jgi:hypothetical protein
MPKTKDFTELKNYELTIDDINFDGCTAISLVEYPAIELNWMVFSKNNNFIFAKVIEEKRIITGPSLVPNKLIYRVNPFTGEEFNVFFSEDTVKKISEQFLIQNKNSNVTLDHNMNVNDVSLVESWIVEDPKNDKANVLGYEVQKGTWMCSMKVNNDEIWNNYIKEGKVKGYSLEGYFSTKYDKYSKEEVKVEPEKVEPEKVELTEDEIILNKIKDILKELDIDDKKN